MWERGGPSWLAEREEAKGQSSVCRGWETDPCDVKADIRTVSDGSLTLH